MKMKKMVKEEEEQKMELITQAIVVKVPNIMKNQRENKEEINIA
jgi:hypothetical protein